MTVANQHNFGNHCLRLSEGGAFVHRDLFMHMLVKINVLWTQEDKLAGREYFYTKCSHFSSRPPGSGGLATILYDMTCAVRDECGARNIHGLQ